MHIDSLVILTFREDFFKQNLSEAGVICGQLLFPYPNSPSAVIEDVKEYRPRLVIFDNDLHDIVLEQRIEDTEETKWDHDIHLDKVIFGEPRKKHPGVYECSTMEELKKILETL